MKDGQDNSAAVATLEMIKAGLKALHEWNTKNVGGYLSKPIYYATVDLIAAPTQPNEGELVKALEEAADALQEIALWRKATSKDVESAKAACKRARQALANYRARKGEQG
jgi:hypothetical protein